MGTAAEQEARASLKAKSSALTDATKEAKHTATEHNRALAAKQQALKAQHAKQQERARVAFIKDSALNMLLTGGWEDDEAYEEALGTVTELLKSLDAELALLNALPGAFKLKPDARHHFDKIIEDAAVQMINAQVAKLDKELAVMAPEVEDISAEALGLWAIHSQAEESVQQLQCEKSAAEEAWKAASARHAEAEENMVGQHHILELLEAKVASRTTELQQLEESVCALERLHMGRYGADDVSAPHAMDVSAPHAMDVEAKADVEPKEQPNVVAVH